MKARRGLTMWLLTFQEQGLDLGQVCRAGDKGFTWRPFLVFSLKPSEKVAQVFAAVGIMNEMEAPEKRMPVQRHP